MNHPLLLPTWVYDPCLSKCDHRPPTWKHLECPKMKFLGPTPEGGNDLWSGVPEPSFLHRPQALPWAPKV